MSRSYLSCILCWIVSKEFNLVFWEPNRKVQDSFVVSLWRSICSCKDLDFFFLSSGQRSIFQMGKKRIMLPAKDIDLSSVKYEPEVIQGQLHDPVMHIHSESTFVWRNVSVMVWTLKFCGVSGGDISTGLWTWVWHDQTRLSLTVVLAFRHLYDQLCWWRHKLHEEKSLSKVNPFFYLYPEFQLLTWLVSYWSCSSRLWKLH